MTRADASAIETLTAEVTRLAGLVDCLVQREIAVGALLEHGQAIGRGNIPDLLPPLPPGPSRPPRGKHLHSVDGKPDGGT